MACFEARRAPRCDGLTAEASARQGDAAAARQLVTTSTRAAQFPCFRSARAVTWPLAGPGVLLLAGPNSGQLKLDAYIHHTVARQRD